MPKVLPPFALCRGCGKASHGKGRDQHGDKKARHLRSIPNSSPPGPNRIALHKTHGQLTAAGLCRVCPKCPPQAICGPTGVVVRHSAPFGPKSTVLETKKLPCPVSVN